MPLDKNNETIYNNQPDNQIISSSSDNISLSTEKKFMKIKELTDRFNHVVTRAGTHEFQQHYDYLMCLVMSIEQNNYKSICDPILQKGVLRKKFILRKTIK